MSDHANASATTTDCLSEEDVLAFAGGQLSLTRRRDAHLHFDRCELCQELLNEAVHALATAPTTAFAENDEVAWNTTFRPGTLVGQRYVIRRFIARGGMGEVYEAFDQELQERVALKTVTSTACDNPSAVRRLKAEVQLARRVSHPNVCRIYDFGTHLAANTGSQISFLTMEFVAGITLGKHLRTMGALPIEEARALGRQLLHGLKAAHDAGVLHRDFKSDNVILRQDAERLQPLILDFGLARALDREAEHSSSSNHGLIGTFAYIAPEQLEGKPFSTASDIYSFGLVWYEMLTGELPFKPSSSPALPALERLTRPVPAPSSKNPRVPSDLDGIVLACLRRSSAERLQTAGAVLARLDALERAEPTQRTRRALAPWVVAAGLVAGATYLALGTHERASTASASEPATSPPKAPPEPVTQVAAPGQPEPAKQQPPSEPSARQANKRRPMPSQPAPTPKSQDQPQKSPDTSGPSDVQPSADPHPGWEPFPEKG